MATRFRDFIDGSPDSSGSSLALKEAFGRKPISSGFAPPPQLEGGALCDSRFSVPKVRSIFIDLVLMCFQHLLDEIPSPPRILAGYV